MRQRPSFWLIVSLLALVGAGVFWRLGERRAARDAAARPPAAAPAGAARPAAPAGVSTGGVAAALPAGGMLARPPATNAPASPAEHARRKLTARESLRLRNTAEPLDALLRNDHALLLRNALVDTRAAAPEAPAALRAGPEPGAWLVQARGPVDLGLREAVARAGASVVAYIPNNAYLVRATAAQAEQLRRTPRTQAVLPYEPYYKLEDSLLRAELAGEPLAGGAELNVVLFPGAEAEGRAALEALGAQVVAASATPFGPQFAVRPAAAGVAALARLPAVQTLEPRRHRALLNDLTRVLLNVSTSTTNAPLQGTNYLGLTGSNVWINVNDTGVDVEHPDLEGRVTGNDPSALVDLDGHGTHVAATIAGSGRMSDSITNLPGSLVPGADLRGQAPAAELFAQPIDLQTGPLISDHYLQTNAAATYYLGRDRDGIPISNNSWGYIGAYEYDTAAASYDAAVRDALEFTPGEQPILYVFAAGNDGFGDSNGQDGEPGSISSPATGKNVITVGATELPRNITNEVVFVDEFGETVTNQVFLADTDSADEVVSFSSRGNVGIGTEGIFGRFKPDVVAPGSFIASARSQDWLDPDRFFSSLVQFQRDEVVAPGGQNGYLLYVPDNAESFRIRVLSSSRSPVPFPGVPVYVRYDQFPTPADLVDTNNLVEVPPDRPFRPGFWFYAVGNPLEDPLFYSVQTLITLTNSFGGGLSSYFEELKRLNDGLAPHYRFESGTSMAAPAVTGFLGLMQEWFQNEERPVSPALLKALLINGSRSLGSRYSFETRPIINYQGWGLPNLTNTLPAGDLTDPDDAARPVQYLNQSPALALATGEAHTWNVEFTTNALENIFKLTLVWTDPPGNPAAGVKLVNDLDLIVTNLVSGEVFLGNDIPFRSDFNVPHTNAAFADSDIINNVENILIRPRLGARYSVTVAAKRVNVNAVTAHPDDVVQDFALVMSVEDVSLTNAFKVAPAVPVLAPTLAPSPLIVSNAVPLLGQRTGANPPLLGGTNGRSAQWRFFRFINSPDFTPPELGITNGPNVAILTFIPPNVGAPRFRDADVDLYVTRGDPGLTNLAPASLAAAFKSTQPGGSELVFFTNSFIGEVFYIGVKAEDQQAGEFSLVGLSSLEPFSERDADGNVIARGLPGRLPIPDGSPDRPGAGFIFSIVTEPVFVANVTAEQTVAFESTGDLFFNLAHNGRFVVLNSNPLDPVFRGVTVTNLTYDDSNSGQANGFGVTARPSSGPGRLTDFNGEEGYGAWILTLVDAATFQQATNTFFQLRIQPYVEDDQGIALCILPNAWDYYFIDVPAQATNLTITLTDVRAGQPLDVYIRRGDLPTFTEYDKRARIAAPGGSVSLGTRDVPPLNPGRYFVGIYNPNSILVCNGPRLLADVDFDLLVSGALGFPAGGAETLRDDATYVSRITVPVDRLISDVKVGLRVDHPRVSDLAFTLVHPQGIRLLLAENRGGPDGRAYGADLGTNRVFTTFTDDTNLTTRPIKFGRAPFIEGSRPIGGAPTVVLDDGFERGAPGIFVAPPATNFSAGWFLQEGLMEVKPAGGYRGGQYVSFQTVGEPVATVLFTNLTVESGRSYRLGFAYFNDAFPAAPQDLSVRLNGTNLLRIVAAPLMREWNTTSVVFQAQTDAYQLSIVTSGSSPATVVNGDFDQPVLPFGATYQGILVGQQPQGFGWRVISGDVEVLSPSAWPGDQGQSLDMNGLTPGAIEQEIEIRDPGTYRVEFSLGANPIRTIPTPAFRTQVLWGPVGSPLSDFGVYSAQVLPRNPVPPHNANWRRLSTPDFTVPVAGRYILRFVSLTPGDGGNTLDRVEVRRLFNPSGPAIDAFRLESLEPPQVAYYLSEEPLEPLLGERALGDWFLEVADTRAGPSGGDTGRLLDWRLELVFALPNVSAVLLTNGVPYFGTVRGDEILYFIVETPRCATAGINLISGPFASLFLFGDRDGLPDAQFGAFTDDYGPYFNVEPGGIASFQISTNFPPAAPLRPGQRYYLAVRNLADDQNNPFAIFVDFDCKDDDVLNVPVLTNGVPRDGTIPPGALLDHYRFDVSPYAIRATFELIPRNGNVDLYVKQGGPGVAQPLPGPQNFDFRSENPDFTVPDVIVVDRFSFPGLAPGPWYLGVLNGEAVPVDYTVRVTEEYANVVRLTNGVPYTNLITVTNFLDYYVFNVSSNSVLAQFETLGADGDVNLYLRSSLPLPVPADAQWRSENTSTNNEFIEVRNTDTPLWLTPGDWFLGVANADAGPVAYGIRATEFPGTVIPLTNAVAHTNLIAPGPAPDYYSFNVSAGAIQAAFEVFGLSDDVDLVLRRELPLPTFNDRHYLSTNSGTADEIILVTPFSFPTPLTPGTWYLGVINRSAAPAAYSVRATESLADIIPLTNGVPYQNIIADGAGQQYYSFEVATNAVAVDFRIPQLDGNVDLFARRSLPLPGAPNAEYASTNAGTVPEVINVTTSSVPPLTSGTWYLAVTNRSAAPVLYDIVARQFFLQPPDTNIVVDIVLTNGQVCLTWNSIPGTNYHVVAKINATDPLWTPVSPTITATNIVTTFCLDDEPWRFFDVRFGEAPPAPVPPVEFTGLEILDDEVCLTWRSAPGVTYHVEGKRDALAPVWSVVPPGAVLASAPTTTLCVPLDLGFTVFRLRLGPPPPPAPPRVLAPGEVDVDVLPGQVCLTWFGRAGVTYVVEGTDTLTPPAWAPVSDYLVGEDREISLCFTLVGPGLSFLRVVENPEVPAAPPERQPVTITDVRFDPVTQSICLDWVGLTGYEYVVEGRPTAAEPRWIPLTGRLPATGALMSHCVSLADTPFRYFQVSRYPVSAAPVIEVEVRVTPAGTVLTWTAPAGTRFRVFYSTQIPMLWVPFPSEVTPVDGVCTFVDDGSHTPGGRGEIRFYRVEQWP